MQQLVWDVPAPPSAGGAVVVCVRGDLAESDHAGVVDTLTRLLHEHTVVVLDVADLRLQRAAEVHVFSEALLRAGGWPWVRLVLARPDTTLAALLATSRVGHETPAFGAVEQAVAHLDDRPPIVRATWNFGLDTQAARRARGYLRAACDRWDLHGDAREAAEIVITELVTNAVEHAGSPSVVVVERRDATFRLTVRDFGTEHHVPEAAIWIAPPTSSPRGRGLAMVAAVSHTWGVEAHVDGTTVWAEMSL